MQRELRQAPPTRVPHAVTTVRSPRWHAKVFHHWRTKGLDVRRLAPKRAGRQTEWCENQGLQRQHHCGSTRSDQEGHHKARRRLMRPSTHQEGQQVVVQDITVDVHVAHQLGDVRALSCGHHLSWHVVQPQNGVTKFASGPHGFPSFGVDVFA